MSKLTITLNMHGPDETDTIDRLVGALAHYAASSYADSRKVESKEERANLRRWTQQTLRLLQQVLDQLPQTQRGVGFAEGLVAEFFSDAKLKPLKARRKAKP